MIYSHDSFLLEILFFFILEEKSKIIWGPQLIFSFITYIETKSQKV